MVISRSVLLRIRNVSDKSCRENQNTHFVFSNFFCSFENRVIYAIMWENIVVRGRAQVVIWRMRIECWIPEATNTHSGYEILICFSTAVMVARTHVNFTLYVGYTACRVKCGMALALHCIEISYCFTARIC
jgi:hypothetical protein